AAFEEQARARWLVRRAGDERQAADGGDGGQRLPAKAERGDALQVVHAAELARGVAAEGQLHLAGANAGAVIGDADQALAALLDLDGNRASPRVERVLDELLHHRGGTLDHLPGGDLVGDLGGQHTYRHGTLLRINGPRPALRVIVPHLGVGRGCSMAGEAARPSPTPFDAVRSANGVTSP